MDFKVENFGNVEVVTFAGDLTIQAAPELRTALLDCLDKTSHLVLNFEKVTDIDLTALQLFCSAYRTALTSNKCFTLMGDNSPVLAQVVKDTGFLSCLPSIFSMDNLTEIGRDRGKENLPNG